MEIENETELRPLAEILAPLIDRLRGNAAGPVHKIAVVRFPANTAQRAQREEMPHAGAPHLTQEGLVELINEIYRAADEREQRRE